MTSSPQSKCKIGTAAEATLAKSLAPEEVRRGDFVTPLYVVAEVPSFWWRCDSWTQPIEEPVRMRFLPPQESTPLKVRSVCLPFVLVKTPKGEKRTIDVRSCQLARLDRTYAKRAWKAIKSAPKPKAAATTT
jgi:hypothetical protein